MKRIMKCCLAVALGFAVAGCSKGSSGDSDGGTGSKQQEHKKVQLWKDGPYWAETNIGAENPWDSGYYFWWGDTIGYKRVKEARKTSDGWGKTLYIEEKGWGASDGSSSNFQFDASSVLTCKNLATLHREGWTTSDGVLLPEHDAAHVHWGGDWRMPTLHELRDLRLKCDLTWTTTNGVNGYVVCGRGDYASASVFLPAAGYGHGASLHDSGMEGLYWSSVPKSDDGYSWGIRLSAGYRCTYPDDGYRYFGRSVRPVQK